MSNAFPALIRVTEQSAAPAIGEFKALRMCAPTCFFMLGKAYGYLAHGPGSDIGSFAARLDWDKNFEPRMCWMRPQLAGLLRDQYGMSIVSWQLNGNTDASDERIARMVEAGYLRTPREIEFYKTHAVSKSVRQIVQERPAIVGVRPGFGANKDAHAVIITRWTDDTVEIIDPDERNTHTIYSPRHVQQYLNPTGGGVTVVLPRA